MSPATKSRLKPAVLPKGTTTLDLDCYVSALVTFIANKLHRTTTAVYQREFGVTAIEWRIIALLAIEPGIPASRICHVIGVNKGAMGRTIGAMERRRLIAISADPNDGRRHRPSLTAKGRLAYHKVIVSAHERARRLLSSLSVCEQKALIDLLQRPHEHLSASTDGPNMRGTDIAQSRNSLSRNSLAEHKPGALDAALPPGPRKSANSSTSAQVEENS